MRGSAGVPNSPQIQQVCSSARVMARAARYSGGVVVVKGGVLWAAAAGGRPCARQAGAHHRHGFTLPARSGNAALEPCARSSGESEGTEGA